MKDKEKIYVEISDTGVWEMIGYISVIKGHEKLKEYSDKLEKYLMDLGNEIKEEKAKV